MCKRRVHIFIHEGGSVKTQVSLCGCAVQKGVRPQLGCIGKGFLSVCWKQWWFLHGDLAS